MTLRSGSCSPLLGSAEAQVMTSRPASSEPTRRLVEQRVRNRIIEYLELAASFKEQLAYERNAPIANVAHEVINQWED